MSTFKIEVCAKHIIFLTIQNDYLFSYGVNSYFKIVSENIKLPYIGSYRKS